MGFRPSAGSGLSKHPFPLGVLGPSTSAGAPLTIPTVLPQRPHYRSCLPPHPHPHPLPLHRGLSPGRGPQALLSRHPLCGTGGGSGRPFPQEPVSLLEAAQLSGEPRGAMLPTAPQARGGPSDPRRGSPPILSTPTPAAQPPLHTVTLGLRLCPQPRPQVSDGSEGSGRESVCLFCH